MKAYKMPSKLSRAETCRIMETVLHSKIPDIVATVLFVLYKRGWHKDKIKALFADVVALYSMPTIFGKELTDENMCELLAERCDINWQLLTDAAQMLRSENDE